MENSVQENKKKNRVGPHGVGDPDDISLRKMEMKLLIPQIRREYIKNEKCPKEIEEYQNCVLKTGLFMSPIKCRKSKIIMGECLEYWNDDDELTAKATKEYLNMRSEYRRTGINKENREKILNYLKEKKEQS